MRSPTFQRRMALLALVAMLLLFAVPTAGRMLAGSANADGVWAQMCTMAGLKWVKLAPDGADPMNPDPTPTSPAGSAMAGEDCAYCPVLGGLAILLLCLVFALPAPSRRPPIPWRLSAPRSLLYPCGLGSRGPPLAL
ncbi:DUF2946 family protein [Lysobacter silvisoli]|uniref:DUF2946 domain-containing protein n=1 Tax=Lysobacter silvisoli TaxID=2293254 RepID=A0A371K4S7_9GAMM|nr:DUF2946 family protein [Lysobacter silvisoli]RDZ28929.1 DUF2946 domain-containing protein [Lysobacter silvisoli]